MKRACKLGLEILLAGSIAFGFPGIKSSADEHTEYLDSKKHPASNFSSGRERSERTAETSIAVGISQELECDFEIAGMWDKKKSCYAPFDDIYGIYLIVKNPDAKVVCTRKLGGSSKPGVKEKYDMFHNNDFAAFANSRLISQTKDEISWELSPAEGGRLVFGKIIEKKWLFLDKKTIEVSSEWYFNAESPGAHYINIGNKGDPLPSDYPLGPVKVKK